MNSNGRNCSDSITLIYVLTDLITVNFAADFILLYICFTDFSWAINVIDRFLFEFSRTRNFSGILLSSLAGRAASFSSPKFIHNHFLNQFFNLLKWFRPRLIFHLFLFLVFFSFPMFIFFFWLEMTRRPWKHQQWKQLDFGLILPSLFRYRQLTLESLESPTLRQQPNYATIFSISSNWNNIPWTFNHNWCRIIHSETTGLFLGTYQFVISMKLKERGRCSSNWSNMEPISRSEFFWKSW